MDHDLFYVLTITLVFPLFKNSDLMEKYPCDLTLNDMLEKAATYLGKRYEYFQYLLNDGKMPKNTLETGYELKRMSEKGEGIVATRNFKQGDVVMRGEIVRILGGNHSHAAQIGENVWAIHEGITHKANHSCDPNMGISLNETGGHDFVAVQDVEAGEELVLDYAMRNYQIEHFPYQCKCGSVDCRGSITGWKDLPEHKKRNINRGQLLIC